MSGAKQDDKLLLIHIAEMKSHLVIHSIVFFSLLLIGVYAWLNVWTWVLPRDLAILISYALAVFSSLFGICKAAQYNRKVENGCEITVTTAEAKIFPYMFYFACAVFASIWLLRGS